MSSEVNTLKLTTKVDVEPSSSIGLLPKINDVPTTSGCTTGDDIQRRREAQLRQHSFFQLRIHLLSGHGLVAMDKSGTYGSFHQAKTKSLILIVKQVPVIRTLSSRWVAGCCTNRKPFTRNSIQCGTKPLSFP